MFIELWILVGFLFLVIIGAIILLLIGSLIRFFPATLAAIFVLMFTGNWLLAGLAFLVVAIIMAVAK
ncbi:MAG TPA: hypothetical protein PLR51_04645 [Methanomassiliicoccales archaeon]|nr:hypothetical protein [Methanomassiliicoccales archaeon]HQQ25552.1 hypothetical protein [Methanomassiliicoccales archaeon]